MDNDIYLGAARAMAEFAGVTIADTHLAAGGEPAHEGLVRRMAQVLWQKIETGSLSIATAELAEVLKVPETDLDDVLTRSPIIHVESEDAGDLYTVAGSSLPNDTTVVTGKAALVFEAGRLFSARHWYAQRQIATSLGMLANSRTGWIAEDALVGKVLGSGRPDPLQARAVRIGIESQLLILSGGPGTGKTTTLGALVGALRLLRPESRIAVAAPTGKAAARLAESISEKVVDLGGGATDHLAAGHGLGPSTLHRLLGYRPNGHFLHDEVNPLPHDVVIVDECSMVDALLGSRLLRALARGTQLILAGDRDQLSSVEPGAFFGAVCQAGQQNISDCTVMLETNYRQASAPQIVAWSDAIRGGTLNGDLPPTGKQVFFDIRPIQEATQVVVQRAVHSYLPLVTRAATPQADGGAALLDSFEQFRVLSVLRAGPYGVEAINRAIARQLRPAGSDDPWYAGRLIIVTRNLPSANLFNGDTGLTVRLEGGQLGVVFLSAGGHRVMSPLQIPAHADAFALTVHQSQGSAFDEVLLIPAPAEHPLATRSALYTAVTRARHKLTLFAEAQDLRWAAETVDEQDPSLAWRLR